MREFIERAADLAHSVKMPLSDVLPYVKVTPIMSVTEIRGLEVRESFTVMMEARGRDGTYTRGYSDIVMRENQL